MLVYGLTFFLQEQVKFVCKRSQKVELLSYIMDYSIYDSIFNPDLIDHFKRVGIVFNSAEKQVS